MTSGRNGFYTFGQRAVAFARATFVHLATAVWFAWHIRFEPLLRLFKEGKEQGEQHYCGRCKSPLGPSIVMVSPGFYGGRSSRQRRYCRPGLFHCRSPAAAYTVAIRLRDGLLWQRSGRERGGTTSGRACSARHHRHVAGRAARGRPIGRRAANRVRPWLLCRSYGGGKIIR
jgi:hypothetical protein